MIQDKVISLIYLIKKFKVLGWRNRVIIKYYHLKKIINDIF